MSRRYIKCQQTQNKAKQNENFSDNFDVAKAEILSYVESFNNKKRRK